jgi:sulfatase modifying factor 1
VRSFMIGRHEVTWDEWRAVQLYGSSRGYDLGTMRLNIGTHPVDSVNWYDAVKYCNALSEMEGLRPVYLNPTTSTVYRSGENLPVIDERANGYRLPTSAEWEMAARAGPGSPVYDYSGSNILSQVGRYIANSTGAPFDMYYGGGQGTWPVGGLLPNALGIYDMSGNVREWCWDTDPGVGFGMQATVRGGSWLDSATNCRVDWRGDTSASTRYLLYGFRVASGVDPVEEPPDSMTLVTGGTLPAQSALGAVAVPGFYLSHFEVTWEEFRSVFTFAGVLGYDNPSTWFDSNEGVQEGDRPFSNDWTTAAIKWCNLLSEVEGLTPVYRRVSTGGVIRHGSLNFQDVRAETGADGYRLPTEAEWEWAARGGVASQGFAYSGSNALDGVGWYAGNSGGNEIHLRIGRKLPNELQLFDMSGGVWEMCWAGDGNDPVFRGGDRMSPATDCAVGSRTRTGIGPMAIGFRLARTISN